MESRKDVFDLLRDWMKSERSILILIVTSCFVALVVLPHFLIKDNGGWNELAAISTFAYMLITLCAFVVIVVTAIAAYEQLRLLRKTLEASSYSQLYSRLDVVNGLLVENIKDLRLEKDTFTSEDFAFSTPERHFANLILTLYENVYYQKENSHVLDNRDWNAWKLGVKDTFKVKYITEYWWKQGGRNFYTREFQKEIENILAEPDTSDSC